jgi:hypothetical protein
MFRPYPDWQRELRPAWGPVIWDDFIRPGDGTSGYGDLGWELVQIGGSAPSTAVVSPSSALQCGLRSITSAAAANAGGALSFSATPFYRAPSIGSVWAVKFSITSVTAFEAWSGFVQTATSMISGATSNDFVGVRQAAGGNLFGIVRDGTSETTVDLLTTAAADVVAGFERTDDGIQFFTADLSDAQFPDRTDVGDPVSTNLPNTQLRPVALAIAATAAANKVATVDFWALGGRVAR